MAAQERLTVRNGDVLDAASVAAALAGADAAVCAIGPAKNGQPGTLISEGAKNILAGCASAGVRRFVYESGMMAGDGSELSFTGRLAIRFAHVFLRKLYAEKVIAEAAVQASGLGWVIVRPPMLEHGPAKANYLAGPRARISPAKAISHADCAALLVEAATTPKWVRQVVNIGRA